ncbi:MULTISPECIES: hypothetical protein [unclassified Haladaptatus]|uniref:hypothetical protein n=1 Tax=unclassified Haladaptatus TaxID=2622732 RepID=UPI00209BD39A|nr:MULTISPECIES: hypothetical protein [unclassified Haladaptatus]MCO8246919.1 hypothetical protein [Haladaptatus sp. AB643]MCO8253555.1 hypothetical protein [Haladaptatus sp. AB618]
MQRRDILKRAGAATTVGILAGCLSRDGGSPGGSGSESTNTTTTTTTTTTADGTTTEEMTTKTGTETTTSADGGESNLKDGTVKVLSSNCGTPKNEASVEVTDSRMVITGTIGGSDSCAIPYLKSTKTDPKTGTYMVTVGTKKKSGTVGCSECLTKIEYRATLTFAGSVPKSVKVTHESMGKSKVVASTDGSSSTTEN